MDFYEKYLKYKRKYLEQKGGLKHKSFITQVINRINTINNQTIVEKTQFNNKVGGGHGSLLLGSSSSFKGGEKMIRILVSAQYRSNKSNIKISSFGGGSEPGEIAIHTMIRETIEEIFNFIPNKNIIVNIERYLLSDNVINDYYIYDNDGSYTYIFDVSILGNFIDIIIKNGINRISLPVPHGIELKLIDYLDNSTFNDLSSVDSTQIIGSENKNLTIKLTRFMSDRIIDNYRFVHSLNEVYYISFPCLHDIINISKDHNEYYLYNYKINKRFTIEFLAYFKRMLTFPILKQILDVSKTF